MDVVFEIVGWFGAVAVLVAYLSVSMGWLRPTRRFQVANLIGSCAFIINGAFHGAWPSVVTNIAWGLISVIALVRMPQNNPEPLQREMLVQGEMLVTPPGPPETLAELAGVSETD
ncbi:MAG TPA: hypothetical protein VJQ61_12635 [Sinomonas sp.]|nr:hypothetical protein [Sinomonas sp.]